MKIITHVNGICGTNTYLIIDDGKAVAIDPADDADGILQIAKSHNASVTDVLVTHAHFDHIGALRELKAQSARVYASEDYKLVDELNAMFVGDASGLRFTPDVTVRDGDVIEINGHSFEVISTPGHTPHGVCFVTDGEKIFTGDTLFRLSIERTDFTLGNKPELIKTVKMLFALDGDYEVFPGHGEPTTLDYERKNNPYVG